MPVWTKSLLMGIGRALFWGEFDQITYLEMRMIRVGRISFDRYTNQPQPRRAGVHFTGTGNLKIRCTWSWQFYTDKMVEVHRFWIFRRSNSIPVNPIYGGRMQAQHKTNHSSLRLQVVLMTLAMILTTSVRMLMVIVMLVMGSLKS